MEILAVSSGEKDVKEQGMEMDIVSATLWFL